MNPRNEHELRVTRKKLEMLQATYQAAHEDTAADTHTRELERHSIRRKPEPFVGGSQSEI